MSPSEPTKRRVSLDLSQDLLDWLDSLKSQLGHRSRGAILEHLLGELRAQESDEADEGDAHLHGGTAEVGDLNGHVTPAHSLDDSTAIVLIRSGPDPSLDQASDAAGTSGSVSSLAAGLVAIPRRAPERLASQGSSAGGIQLPGFVRRQVRELRRSLEATPTAPSPSGLALIGPNDLSEALARADEHWLQVYGQAATEVVVEAAMVWLARDIWPQSDHSDGRPFSWNLTQQVVSSFAPAWTEGEATLARVITAAGVLEDPFSGSTLALRVPTLITRFVQRHRSRQKRTTSFEAIDQSMSVHGALRLLQLPTIADRPYSLKEIRDAYREQAQSHHPDAGGSAEAMRRLNEAYQFLKERYRRAA